MALVLGVLGTLPVLHLLWRVQPVNDLDVLVFDVSVSDGSYDEHAVLDRIFDNERVPFDLGSDHVGAAPGGAPFGTWPRTEPELIILADGYGVYADENGQIGDRGRTLVSPTLDAGQAADVERWIANGVPAYGEFALTIEPTSIEASEYVQDAFGFDSLGWVGHAEEDLSEVSPVIRSLGPSPWPYDGPGMIFLTVEAGAARPEPQLVVLTAAELDHLQPVFSGGPAEGRGDHSSFAGWFELVEPTTAAIESWLEMPVNPVGAEVLADAGIPLRWPGVVSTPTTVYVVGDGLGDSTGFAFRKFAFGEWMSSQFGDTPDERFFHQILRPSVSRVVQLAVDRAADEAVVSSLG